MQGSSLNGSPAGVPHDREQLRVREGVFGPGAQALMSMVAARPGRGPALEHATDGSGGLGDIERHFVAYLDDEKKLGRIGPGADTETLAFTLLGTAHQVISRQGDAPVLRQQVQRIVAALIAGIDSRAAESPSTT